jgi:hypothetical protein
VAGAPFTCAEGVRVGWTGWGIGWLVVGRHYGPSDSVGRGKRWGEWGVMRGGGAQRRFRKWRDARATRVLEAVAAMFGWPRPGEEGSQAGPTQQ